MVTSYDKNLFCDHFCPISKWSSFKGKNLFQNLFPWNKFFSLNKAPISEGTRLVFIENKHSSSPELTLKTNVKHTLTYQLLTMSQLYIPATLERIGTLVQETLGKKRNAKANGDANWNSTKKLCPPSRMGVHLCFQRLPPFK